jgi:hypothetical protein
MTAPGEADALEELVAEQAAESSVPSGSPE